MNEISPIKCPCCLDYLYSLLFLKKIGEKCFFVCEKCLRREKSEDELLLIGFRAGHEAMYAEAMDRLHNINRDE